MRIACARVRAKESKQINLIKKKTNLIIPHTHSAARHIHTNTQKAQRLTRKTTIRDKIINCIAHTV